MSLNLLVVDDSRVVHGVIAKTLELAEVDINQRFDASNGQEALEILNANTIDLVFSDIHMPVMDGIELITSMKNNDNLKSIPVVVISSEGGQKRVNELKSLGINQFIRKPFTPEEIRAVINEVMGGEHV